MAGTFRILIATDNHLGFLEKEETRRDDSFLAVQEVFEKSYQNNADFLLLGGDLFHENTPSKYTLNRTFEIFNNNVLGHRDHQFKTLSTEWNLNYLNPSLQISMPVFIVHGNHDDPSVDTRISAIDLLQNSNYVNYIYGVHKEDVIEVSPVELSKGETLVAIYGLGYVKDETLNWMFKENKVKFKEPSMGSQNYFNILVVHQNRFKGSGEGAPARNCVMDWAFPNFIDLVVWGHEHESIPNVRKTEGKDYVILQPGSTVATALTSAEAKPKNAFLLEVRGLGFRLNPLPLLKTRALVFDSLDLGNLPQLEAQETVLQALQNMLRYASQDLLNPPLLRLKVRSQTPIDTRSLSHQVSCQTANSNIVTVSIVKSTQSSVAQTNTHVDDILSYLQKELSKSSSEFQLFSPKQFVEHSESAALKNDTRALETLFEGKVNMACNVIMKHLPPNFNEQSIMSQIDDLNVANEPPSFKRPNLSADKSSKKPKK